MTLTTTLKNTLLQQINTAATSGYMRFYDGSSVLLAEDRFGSTAFATPSGGSMTANSISAAGAVSAGTIASAKMLQSDGVTEIATLTVGIGTGDVQLSRLDIRVGEPVQVSTCTLSIS